MEQEKFERRDDDFTTVDQSMISSTSPYQPTTEPVPHRRSLVAGMVVEMRFLKSLPGILKVVEIVFSIIVAACVGSAACGGDVYCAPLHFMRFVSATAIICTLILYIIYALNLVFKLDFIDWPLTDLLNSVIFFLLYLIGSSVMAANLMTDAGKAATAFGFICAVLYSASAWFAWNTYMIERRKRHSPVSHIKGVSDNTETQELA